MKCCNCANWNLRGSPTREAGYSLCAAEPVAAFAKARGHSPTSLCRIASFKAATAKVIAARVKVLKLTAEEIAE